MLVSDIIKDLKRVLGTCNQAEIFDLTTRAVEVLSAKGVFDPLVGTYDFNTNGSNVVVLPRDVKSVMRCNVNNNPAFARARIFEFALNTDGTVLGDELGFAWHDRGNSPIQNESALPCKLKYKCTNSSDEGKTVTVNGRDIDGREISETLTAAESPEEGTKDFFEVTSVVRDETDYECILMRGDDTVARYYGDETNPSYKRIKISKKVASVRVLYRKTTFKISSLSDIIPIPSAMAVIHAASSIKKGLNGQIDESMAELSLAEKYVTEEQQSLDSSAAMSQALEIQSSVDFRISAPNCVVAGDVYADASDAFGPIGRMRLLGHIQNAVEILSSKTRWDSTSGHAVVKASGGIIALPRFVDNPLSVSVSKIPYEPLNRWFQFSVNGAGGAGSPTRVPALKFADFGRSPIIGVLEKDEDGFVIPVKLVAIPESEQDDDALVMIYGVELVDGEQREVFRNGKRGWRCPCRYNSRNAGSDAPLFVRIDSIVRDETTGIVKLIAINSSTKLIALVGDAGYGGETYTNAVEELVKSMNPDELILLGDNNYPSGEASTIDSNIGRHWRKFIYPYSGEMPLKSGEVDATRNMLWAVFGNHDIEDAGYDVQLEYLPQNGSRRYFDKVFGDVHVFFLNSEPSEPDGNTVDSVQYQWFAEKANASTSKWKICVFHRAAYSSGVDHGNFEDMQWDFANYGISACLSGHGHNYERQERGGVVYFTAGTGGGDLDDYNSVPVYSKSRHKISGAVFMEVASSTLSFKFIDHSGVIRDEKVLTSQSVENEKILGVWYPDETRPMYRLLSIPVKKDCAVDIRYNARGSVVSSLFTPINLSSKVALTRMLQSMKAADAGDIQKAVALEEMSVRLLKSDNAMANAAQETLQIARGEGPSGDTYIT